ncbi:double-strand break repair protein AddB [Aestuariivirga litoralis]|uniref:Double-strand break repair protein AddB n=1 Tax=Aestuariivirga litoralis TaxID=2650924 RepID=A0A2W2B8S0_9HYPH|nr:double-strand break repair protein AddB [Aestuariivirga litoralis]PZF76478.1 double-strand break repair protein AddB [Aestuariivirga litoralis]
MTAGIPRLFTIAPDKPFLQVLAEAVLKGFPCTDGKTPGKLDLARWTILLPTRRAVRELEEIFFRLTGGSGVLLPRIRPLGDIDEDLLQPEHGVAELGTPVSVPGQLLLLMDLIDEWAAANPTTRLAQEIAAAPHQAGGLAQSLAELLDALETEDVDVTRIADLYGLESARHREAILEFLAIAREKYPLRLAAENAMGPQARRSAILRREARRLEFTRTERPFIAAGSTGSIPATCTLLKAIAGLPNGAVVLPGLDQFMDEASWTAVGPTHPQHAMKQLLQRLNATRPMVEELGAPPGPRAWLASELMRPAEASHLWHGALKGQAPRVAKAIEGVELVETRSVPEQALTAALILRECLETPGRSACLVTPDRQLARRVKVELRRWNITIDDSAGEPLVRFGGASLLNLLLEALLQDFAAEPLAALLRHDLAGFGLPPEEARHLASLIELALLRTGTGAPDIGKLSHALRIATEKDKRRSLPLVTRHVGDEQWEGAIAQAQRISEVLAPLTAHQPGTLAGHLDRLAAACEAMAGEAFWAGEGGDVLSDAFALLKQESRFLRHCDLRRTAAILRHWLHGLPVRSQQRNPAPLSILGLLEARLIRADVMVMAGLNEGTWPGATDCGPWLNRPMRDVLAMKQPEAQIGQTAHDFVQAFGNAEVKLLWSRRIGDAPGTPSRWLHRLLMILETAKLKPAPSNWPLHARKLSAPGSVTPIAMPKPRPAVALRPRALSVTRIEKLIRDPYAIYARFILNLEPVKPVSSVPDPARRGTIFHDAIGDFLNRFPKDLPADVAAELETDGSRHFQQIADYPGLVSFWWPRFRRIAAWIAAQEPGWREGVERVVAERNGAVTFPVAGADFTLSARVDRIDLMADGSARITDFKTGGVPSPKEVEVGLAPQLTLQAAILARGGFRDVNPKQTGQIWYVKLSGGNPAGEVQELKKLPVMDLAERHFAELQALLAKYARVEQPYYPRTIMKKEDDPSDYDHLSRFQEWTLSGGGA